MKILALELSSPEGSIAWFGSGEEPCVTTFANDRKHSGLFFDNLQRGLARFGNPERIVVGLGPGSYAGTRIAIATATGLVAASGVRLVGVPSLCAMETAAPEYAVIGDARRQSFFFARVGGRRCLEGPLLCVQDELTERMGAFRGPVFATEPLAIFPAAIVAYPSALVLGELGAQSEGETTSEVLEPIYLREPHITYPRDRRACADAS